MGVKASDEGTWEMKLDLFKSGGGESSAIDLEVPFLGALPFDPGVVRGGDDGVHRIVADPEGATAIAFDSVVDGILEKLSNSVPSDVKIT